MLAVAEHKGVDNDLIPRIATGFCSGMARSDGMCGAVSGGIMAIGLYRGRSRPTDAIDPCYEAIRAFLEKFSNEFKALSCLELTGVHLGTPEGQAEFTRKGQAKECSNYVGESARMVMEIVEGDNRKT